MILLEGPDRCGKTTVAKHLRKILPNWSYRHHTRPPIEPYIYFGLTMCDSHPRMIVDRMHWSEYAYGHTYRGGSDLTRHQWRLLELMALSHATMCIMLVDDVESITSRWSENEMFRPEPLNELLGHFNDLSGGTSEPVSYIDSRTFRLPDLVEDDKPTRTLIELAAHAARRAQQSPILRNDIPVSLGAGETGGFLILGDNPPDEEKGIQRPPVPFRDGPAATCLWDAMDVAGIAWWRGYYTYASIFWTPETFYEFIESQNIRRIVCLGNQAELLVKRSETKVHTVSTHHPMFWKRFQSQNLEEFADFFKTNLGDYVCKPLATL